MYHLISQTVARKSIMICIMTALIFPSVTAFVGESIFGVSSVILPFDTIKLDIIYLWHDTVQSPHSLP